MGRGDRTHRTTIDIEVVPYERAREALGTRGYKDTVNEALKAVDRQQRLNASAELILGDELELVTPEDLDELRRPRH